MQKAVLSFYRVGLGIKFSLQACWKAPLLPESLYIDLYLFSLHLYYLCMQVSLCVCIHYLSMHVYTHLCMHQCIIYVSITIIYVYVHTSIYSTIFIMYISIYLCVYLGVQIFICLSCMHPCIFYGLYPFWIILICTTFKFFSF